MIRLVLYFVPIVLPFDRFAWRFAGKWIFRSDQSDLPHWLAMFEWRHFFLLLDCYSNSQLSVDRDPRIRRTNNAIYQIVALFLIHEYVDYFEFLCSLQGFPEITVTLVFIQIDLYSRIKKSFNELISHITFFSRSGCSGKAISAS